MKKRWYGRWVLGTLAVMALAGCSEKVDATARNADGSYTNFITVDVYDDFANYQGIQSGWFAKIVKDKFNMELNIIAPNVAGGGQTLYQTRSAAGNLGDLILINPNNGRLNDLVEAGLIMDCSAMMEGKDLMKNYKAAVEVTNDLVKQEGIYVFPYSVSSEPPTESFEGLEPTFGPYVRWDYYKKAGYPEIKNLDDFLDVLETMQKLAREEEGSNDIYAISFFKDWDDSMMNSAKQLACMYGYNEQGFGLIKADGSEYKSIIDDDSMYIKALRFLYEANQRGLVDPDSTTQNYDTWSAKYTNGEVLYCPWPWVGQNLYNTAENKQAGKGFMMAPIEDMQIYSLGNCPEGDATQVIAIGSKAEDPERLADFIDWLYSPEGVELNGQANGAAGIEGLTWFINEDGKSELTDFGKQALPMNAAEVPEEYGGGNWRDGVSALNFKAVNLEDINPKTGEPYDYLCWETVIAENTTPLDVDWREFMGADTTMEYLEENGKILVAPGANYTTPEEDSNITTIRGQCKSAIVDNSWQMVFADNEDEFNKGLENMQITAKGLGFDEVFAVDSKNAQDLIQARKDVVARYEASHPEQ